MSDPQTDTAHCTELVRDADRDRYIATLFAPAELRPALNALYAFIVELRRVRMLAREPMPGEIRLQWWADALGGTEHGDVGGHPVAAALLRAIDAHSLPREWFGSMIEAWRWDLYDESMPTMDALDSHLMATVGTEIALARRILGDASATPQDPLSHDAGLAEGLLGIIQAMPRHASRGQIYLPLDWCARFGVDPATVLAGEDTPALRVLLAALGERAVLHARQARAKQVAPDVRPALLTLAVVEPTAKHLAGGPAFAPGELSALRRLFLIWREARRF